MQFRKTFIVALLATSVFGVAVFPAAETALREILPADKTLQVRVESNKETICMHFFVHGTYASETSLLSLINIYRDAPLHDTQHEKLVRKFIRQRCKSLYDMALMYNEGLWLVDLHAEDTAKACDGLALQPILESFDLAAQDDNTQNVFYLFGWSGFLSAKHRMEAGLALFNSIVHQRNLLQQTLDKAHSNQKIIVKVYTHSHGGNVALNMAWINALVSGEPDQIGRLYQFFGVEQKIAAGVIENGIKILEKSAVSRASEYAMDAWVFPATIFTGRLVDELFLLAAPIQQETWPAMFDSLFGRVFSIYSDGDSVQNLDGISTRRRSARCISPHLVCAGNLNYVQVEADGQKSSLPKVVQVKIGFAHDEEYFAQYLQYQERFKDKTFLGTIKAYFSNSIQDKALGIGLRKAMPRRFNFDGPAHLDFWLLTWINASVRLPLRPMPLLNAVPFLDKALSENSNADFLMLKFAKNDAGIDVVDDKDLVLCSIPTSRFEEMCAIFADKKAAITAGNRLPADDSVARRINAINSAICQDENFQF